MMHGREKSDPAIVATKPPNEARTGAEEAGEPRAGAKGKADQQSTRRALHRESVSQALARPRQAARQRKKERFTALLHHINLDLLRMAFLDLKRTAAPGVDGLTWQDYEADLEPRLRDLHDRVHRGAYRALPSRRRYIPKADGRARPLAIAALEDKIVRRATVAVLNAIYEEDFLGFSYGFRPRRSQHDALDALVVGISSTKVNYILDADIRSFFDAVSQTWLIRFLNHRIGDPRITRLIQKWLKAGVLEEGVVTTSDRGTGQGSVNSPCLSNIYLHHVLDVWFEHTVRPRLKGRASLVRYADDLVMAFETFPDATRVLAVLGKRLARYGLTLHPDKTRLIDFRFKRPEGTQHPAAHGTTFAFLGFTHVWGKSRKGGNVVRQVTAKGRYARALAAVTQWGRDNRHRPIAVQHAHLSAMMRGHYAYYGVTGHSRRVHWYAHQVVRIWQRWLSRRDRQSAYTWMRLSAFLKQRPLPPPRIIHHYAVGSKALS